MRICIYGAGAMGTSLGAFLTKNGYPCDLVTRNREHVFALQTCGVRFSGTGIETVNVSALLPEEMSGIYDVIFLATKQRENQAIAKFLLPFLADDGALITVQNGLPEKGLAEVFGTDRVYGCALGWGAQLEGPGLICLTSKGNIHLALGAYGNGERLTEIANMLGSFAEVNTGNLAEIRYSKLAINASFSTLSAISGLTFGEIAKYYKKYAIFLISEVLCVAEVYGCKQLVQNGHDIKKLFKSPFSRLILPFAMRKHANIRSGMLKDLEAGRRCDIDFVAGAVVKAGKEKGVVTPKLERAVALVHDIENGFVEIAPESLELLRS